MQKHALQNSKNAKLLKITFLEILTNKKNYLE